MVFILLLPHCEFSIFDLPKNCKNILGRYMILYYWTILGIISQKKWGDIILTFFPILQI